MRMASVSQRRYEQRFDSVQSIFSLLERDVHLGFEDFIGYFYPVGHPVGFRDLFAESSFRIVKRRQTMHKSHVRIAGRFHQFHVHLVWLEQLNPFLPDFLCFTHGYPNVGVNEIHPLHGDCGIIDDGQLPAVLGLKLARDLLILI